VCFCAMFFELVLCVFAPCSLSFCAMFFELVLCVFVPCSLSLGCFCH